MHNGLSGHLKINAFSTVDYFHWNI